MNTNYNIDDHLQNSMDNFEIQPRISSFDAVMQKLEKKRRRRFFIFFFFGVGMSLLGSLIILNVSPRVVLAHNSEKHPLVKKIPASKKEFTNDQKILKKSAADKQVAHFQKHSKTKYEKSFISVNVQKKPERKNKHTSVTITQHKNAMTLQPIQGRNSPTQSDKNNSLILDSSNTSEIPFVFLEPKYLALPERDSVSPELISTLTFTLPVEFAQKPDSLVKNKKRFKFMIGLNANPQYGRYQFSENKHRDAVYNSNTGGSFSKLYLENRKKQNSFKFNYAFGIKFGFNVDDKWEAWLSAGIQRYTYSERLNPLAFQNSAIVVGPSGNTYNAPPSSSYSENGFKNSFTYISYGLDFNRIIKPNPFLKLKFGLGLKANNLLMANYIFVKSPDVYYSNNYSGKNYLSLWMYTTNLNMGIIKDLTKRLQFRLSPGIFYSPSSMFNRNYVIKQKTFGLELECLLVLKLF